MFNSKFDKKVKWINRIVLVLLVILTILPLGYVLMASIMEPSILVTKGISFNPADWSFQGYQKIFRDKAIIRGFINSIFYATTFSLLTVFITMITAYPLSKKKLIGRRGIMNYFLVTMFIGGGLVPTYLLIKNLNMSKFGNYSSI